MDTLLDLQADIHCEDGLQGATPLHLAMRFGRSEVRPRDLQLTPRLMDGNVEAYRGRNNCLTPICIVFQKVCVQKLQRRI